MSAPPVLSGVRVLDLSRVLAGPYAAAVLAELGADVVKLESPEGDPARGIGPIVDGYSLYFAAVNTGKRSVVADLTTAAGRDILARLLGWADIVVENFRPRVAERLGFVPGDILGRHPHLVIVTVSGFARSTTWADRPAFDLVVQAEAGVMSVTGEPGAPPARAGVPVGDLAAGLWGAIAAVSGYAARLRDGAGRHLEVPLHDATLAMLSYLGTAALASGRNPERVGAGHHSIVPYGAFPTRDGWMAIAVIGDRFFRSLGRALGLDDLCADPGLATNVGRAHAREKVDHAIAAATARFTTAELDALLDAHDVPHARVNGVLDALTAPYARERGLVVTPGGTPAYQVVRGPLAGDTPARRAPTLGEHTEQVLAELG